MSNPVSDVVQDSKRRRKEFGLRDLSAMKITSLVGDGTYGMVFRAKDKVTGMSVALKKIKMEQETQGFPVTAIREIKILKKLRHRNIVELKEMITYERENDEIDASLINMKVRLSAGDVFMVFEYAEYDLAGLINSSEVVFTENHIRSYTKQLLEGILFMHKNRILHRDIKGANILVTVDNVIKIADLGLARSYISSEERLTSNNKVVTRWYRSPELLLEAKKYGPEIDIWSIGCLFAELKERIAIMQGTSDLHQLELIYALCGTPVAPEVAGKSSSDNGASPDDPSGFLLNGEVYNLYKELPGWKNNPITTHHAPNIANRFSKFDPDSISLLTQMLHMHPKKRITASAALKHAYFTGRNHPPLPKIEDLPKFVNINSGHEFEARQKRQAEYLAKQKEQARLVSRQGMHQQPSYGSGAGGYAQGYNTGQPGRQGHGGHHHQPHQQHHQHHAHHGQHNKRSSQGLTKGFSLISAPAPPNNNSNTTARK